MEPSFGRIARIGARSLRTVAALAIGGLPAAVGLSLIVLGQRSQSVVATLAGYVAFGYLTPVIVASARRHLSAVAAMSLAGGFLWLGSDVTAAGYDVLPWALFAWGLFPAIAVTLTVRFAPAKYLAWVLPLALSAAVAWRMFVPDALLAVAAAGFLVLDAVLLRRPDFRLRWPSGRDSAP